MAELLGVVTKATSSFLELNQVSIDNWAFKLFYKFTTTILVFCSVLTTAKQFFGSPIQCDGGATAGFVEKDVLESYCWMYSTWNVPPKYKGSCSGGEDLIGVSVEEWNDHRTSIVYNSYYQWVPLYLIFLALLFYLPRLFWMIMEGGLMKYFGKGTTTRFIEDQEEKKDILVSFFAKNIHNKYNVYFFGFIGCEVMNLFIVLVQFGFTDTFLHHRFIGYGPKVFSYYRLPEEEQREHKNPMCDTFPRIASCNYWRWGAGGQQENINAICILALNMINDKVFLILWWWFFFISIIGTLRILYRIIQTRSPWLRYQLINMRMNRYFKRSAKIVKIENFVSQCKLGDWFVLYQLSKNLNRPFFMDFLTHLSVRYAHGHVCDEEADTEDDDAPLIGQMNKMLKPSNKEGKLLNQMTVYVKPNSDSGPKAPLCQEEIMEDTGDNFIEMLLKPNIQFDEPDGKAKGGSKDDDDDKDDEKKTTKKSRRVNEDEKDNSRDLPDLPDADELFTRKKVNETNSVPSKGYDFKKSYKR